MTKRLARITSIAMLLALVQNTSAQMPAAGKTELGFQAGGIFFEGDSPLDEDGLYGARVGQYLTANVETELSLLAGRTEIHHSDHQVDLLLPTAELQVHFGEGSCRPFVAAGAGVLNINPERNIQRENTDFVIQVGGGVKWWFAPSYLLRLDARHLIDTESGRGTHNAIVTGGLSWVYGGGPESPKEPEKKETKSADADKDGVPDDYDKCPGTPVGEEVDDDGCSEEVVITPEKEWVLKGISFKENSDKLTPEGMAALEETLQILLKHVDMRVAIQGHMDNRGTPEYNMDLSERRATSVKIYLVNKGIASDRLEIKGVGQTAPIADNNTAAGRAANRRIVFKVLKP